MVRPLTVAKRRLLVAAALLLVASACSAAPAGSPTEPAVRAPVNRHGAPQVKSPRDVRSRVADPCRTLLSDRQLNNLGYGIHGKSRRVIDMAPACDWSSEEPHRYLEASVWVDRDYFIDTSRVRAPIFRHVEIAGLPAVEQQSPVNLGSCVITAATAVGQALDVTSDVVDRHPGGRPVVDPCAEGRRVVEAIVSTLPPL